jgi:aminopeptidase
MSILCKKQPIEKASSKQVDYLSDEIMKHPEKREFPAFDAVRLLGTVFEPTQGCKVCILTDFDDPQKWMKRVALKFRKMR